MDMIWLLVGVALIIFAANWLTDGAASIARRFGISDLVVGLTVVAFGTSTPELSISIVSALQGNAPMAIGNVVGSNIFNILVIIGVVALIRPITVQRSLMVNDIGLVVVSALALLAIGYGDVLGDGTARIVSRVNGILLLFFFFIFLRYTFSQAKSGQHEDDPAAEKGAARKVLPLWRSIIKVVAGLAGLVYGGDRFVAGASGLALSLGMSEAVVGLTIVAAGTSLPELAASVAAAVKGNSGIAIGNVIGSNIFNIFLVLGTTATISPLPFGGISHFDLVVMMLASFTFWLFCWKFGRRTITRPEGAVLVAFYIAYIIYQVTTVST